MRLWVISCFILAGCGHPQDPALDIVRLPRAAYGPFDAAAAREVASSDGGQDAAQRAVATTVVDCFVPGEADEDGEVASAPFDNCPSRHEGNRFNEKATTQRRNRTDRNTCCYSVVRRPQKMITLPEID